MKKVEKDGHIRYDPPMGEAPSEVWPPGFYADSSGWFDDWGELHRDDGPAAVYSDGHMMWYRNGKNVGDSVGPGFLSRDGAP